MFHSLSLLVLLPMFIVGAIAVWIAGVQLSNTSDDLSDRFHLGEALGGLIFLAITTNLPEIAITSAAALSHNLGMAIGNILGGIAVQTLVLVGLDVFALRSKFALFSSSPPSSHLERVRCLRRVGTRSPIRSG
jgi:cation:H+ antiporter